MYVKFIVVVVVLASIPFSILEPKPKETKLKILKIFKRNKKQNEEKNITYIQTHVWLLLLFCCSCCCVVVVVVGRPNVINYKYRFIYIHEQQWKEC